MSAPRAAASDRLAIDGGTPVRDTFLPYHQPLLGADDEASVLETMRSGWLTTGPKTKAFEKALADYVGAEHCVAVNSCTAALHLALEAVGVGAGDEVITSPITFASTANVIVHRGATPVFVDVEPDTFNIDARRVRRAITPQTKAVIPVDLFGQACDMDAIMAIAQRHDLAVIEDAAHAIGAEYQGQRIGGVGQHDRLFVLRDQEHHQRRRRGADDQRRRAGRDASRSWPARHQPRRVEALRHRGLQALGHRLSRLQIQHVRPAGARSALPQLAKIEAFWARRVALKARLDAGLRDLPEIIAAGRSAATASTRITSIRSSCGPRR